MPYLIKEKKSLSDVILLGKDIKEKVKIEEKKNSLCSERI
jgi:hypothetical protein